MIAVPMLTACAGCIGNNRRVRIKEGWSEPCLLWTLLVAPSGATKSPALDKVFEPLQAWEHAEITREKEERAEYAALLREWKEGGKKGDCPEEPEPAHRLLISDATVEAVIVRLESSPAGLIAVRDEWSGWLSSHGQYKSGKNSDIQNWLEFHRAGSVKVDRKTSDTISIERASVSLVGGIQTEVLRKALAGEHLVDGLAARILFVMPPVHVRSWTDDGIDAETRREWAGVLRSLRRIPWGPTNEPVDLPLTDNAKELFVDFFNASTARQNEALEAGDNAIASALPKLRGYAARVALIFELVDCPLAETVGADAMANAIELALWFENESGRVYTRITESDEEREQRKLVEWIAEQGGECTVRDLMRGPRRYRQRDDALTSLDGLVAAGLGVWQKKKPKGRSVKVFVLTGGDGDIGDV